MSNIDENGELEKKISISAEDVDNVLNYSVNFGVEISSGLKLAMEINLMKAQHTKIC